MTPRRLTASDGVEWTVREDQAERPTVLVFDAGGLQIRVRAPRILEDLTDAELEAMAEEGMR